MNSVGNEQYDLLMKEMKAIAENVQLFPASLHESVYETLVGALLNRSSGDNKPKATNLELQTTVQTPTIEKSEHNHRNYATEVIDYYSRYRLSKCNDMEFAAFVAFYFTMEAPEGKRVETISESDYVDVCKITGRPLPKKARGALNNAKNNRGYLESRGKGAYSLSAIGEHFVKHRLLQEND